MKGNNYMALATQIVSNDDITKKESSEKSAIGALYNELSKGIQNFKKGNVYTIDEAWEEIDKI